MALQAAAGFGCGQRLLQAIRGVSWPPLPLQSTMVLSVHVRTCRM